MSPMCPVRACPSAASSAPGPAQDQPVGEESLAAAPGRHRPADAGARRRGPASRAVARRRVDEVLVLEAEDGAPAHGQVAAAGQALGVEAGGPVERLGHRRPPVDDQRLVVGTRDGEAADVEGLARGRPVAGLGEAVDAPEVEGLVADVELLQAGQAGAHDDVALGA